MAKQIIHKDIIGNPIVVGDIVAVTHNNDLKIARVLKQTAKMVRIQILFYVAGRWGNPSGEFLRYPTDMVVLTGNERLTYYLLTGGNT